MELKNVVPWGRSFNEYLEIFNLTDEELDLSILGCGDGPASFNAELTSRGGKVISVDPVYQFSSGQLKNRISEVYDEIMPQAEKNKEMYIWESISSVAELGKTRMDAMNMFISDFESGKATGRYLNGSLPSLNFRDKQFDLALCSHYLFLYSDHISLEEHVSAIKELSRVAKEIRIYPLVSLNGQLSPHLSEVISALEGLKFISSLVNVKYQFQKGATQMLVVKPV